MLEITRFASLIDGPHLLVLGSVHGNEKCGTGAIARVIDELHAETPALVRGSVTFVPCCNPLAFDRDVRFIDRNLNRFLVHKDEPNLYEEKIGNVLCPVLADCDVLLDLHSYTAGGPPFICLNTDAPPQAWAFAKALGAADILTGWEETYEKTGKEQDPLEGLGTTNVARAHGAMALTLECGQHKAPESFAMAERAIRRALVYFGMIDGAVENLPAPRRIHMSSVHYKPDEGAFTRPWKNFEAVGAGEAIARTHVGQELCTAEEGVIIFPHEDCAVGQEWFYLGRIVDV